MKILGICGSPRGGRSQTRVLLEALLDEAKAKGVQVDTVDLAQAIESQRIRFRNLIAFHKDLWPYEYKYWQDMGWM